MPTRREFLKNAKNKGMSKEQALAAANAFGTFDDVTQAPVEKQPQEHRPFFGLSPKKEKAFFPRAVEARGSGGGPFRTAVPGAFDALSVAGRTIASIPALAPGGETFGQAFGRKEALPKKGAGKIGEFLGTALRDPVTGIGIAATGGASSVGKAVAKPIVSKVAPFIKTALKGAREQFFPAVTRQIEHSSRTGEVDVPRQIGAVAFEAGLGGLAEGAGAQAAKIVTPFGKKLLQASSKIKDITARKAGKTIDKGAENIISDIVDFGLESPTGGFSGMATKANKAIKKKTKTLDGFVDAYSKLNPDQNIQVSQVLEKVKSDIASGKTDIIGGEVGASKFIEEMQESLALRGLNGSVPMSKIRETKFLINEMTKGFDKGPFDLKLSKKAQAGQLAYRAINEQFGERIPQAKILGQELRRLYTTEQAMREAQKRVGNHNFLSLRNSFYASAGLRNSSESSPVNILATIAFMGFLKATEKGRGGSALISLGRKKSLPRFSRIAAGEGAAFSADQALKESQRPLTDKERLELRLKQDSQKR